MTLHKIAKVGGNEPAQERLKPEKSESEPSGAGADLLVLFVGFPTGVFLMRLMILTILSVNSRVKMGGKRFCKELLTVVFVPWRVSIFEQLTFALPTSAHQTEDLTLE